MQFYLLTANSPAALFYSIVKSAQKAKRCICQWLYIQSVIIIIILIIIFISQTRAPRQHIDQQFPMCVLNHAHSMLNKLLYVTTLRYRSFEDFFLPSLKAAELRGSSADYRAYSNCNYPPIKRSDCANTKQVQSVTVKIDTNGRKRMFLVNPTHQIN